MSHSTPNGKKLVQNTTKELTLIEREKKEKTARDLSGLSGWIFRVVVIFVGYLWIIEGISWATNWEGSLESLCHPRLSPMPSRFMMSVMVHMGANFIAYGIHCIGLGLKRRLTRARLAPSMGTLAVWSACKVVFCFWRAKWVLFYQLNLAEVAFWAFYTLLSLVLWLMWRREPVHWLDLKLWDAIAVVGSRSLALLMTILMSGSMLMKLFVWTELGYNFRKDWYELHPNELLGILAVIPSLVFFFGLRAAGHLYIGMVIPSMIVGARAMFYPREWAGERFEIAFMSIWVIWGLSGFIWDLYDSEREGKFRNMVRETRLEYYAAKSTRSGNSDDDDDEGLEKEEDLRSKKNK